MDDFGMLRDKWRWGFKESSKWGKLISFIASRFQMIRKQSTVEIYIFLYHCMALDFFFLGFQLLLFCYYNAYVHS